MIKCNRCANEIMKELWAAYHSITFSFYHFIISQKLVISYSTFATNTHKKQRNHIKTQENMRWTMFN